MLRRYGGWLWLAMLLLAVAVLTVISSTSGGSSAPLSLDSPLPNGTLALQLWLSRIGYTVQRQNSYAVPSRDTTLLVLAPGREPSRTEVAALQQWTRTGGRLVVVGDVNTAWLVPLGVYTTFEPRARIRVTQPTLLQPITAHLAGRGELIIPVGVDAGSAAATGYGTVLIGQAWGGGQLRVLTAPYLLDNGNIGRSQNRRLALNLVGAPGRITVDQPGPLTAGTGISNWLTDTAWGIAILFGLAVLVLFRWLGGWRLGPPVIPFSERRRPAVEYVLSLAALLRRAHRREDVLAIYQRELRNHLRRRFGTDDPAALPADVAERVQPLLETRRELTEEELIREADAIVRCEGALKERV